MNLIKAYKEKYVISPNDLTNFGESNRIVLFVLSIILFIFGSGNLLALTIMHFSDLSSSLILLIYFAIFSFSGIFAFIFSLVTKNAEKEKSFIIKTVPCIIIIFIMFFASLYNFYLLDQPFNGFVTFCLTGFISLCIFSFSPLIFLAGLIISISLMAPGLFKHFGTTGLADSILTAILMFFLALYKQRNAKKQIILLQKQALEAKTFGNFTLLYNDKVVKFSRRKSNELIAYLIYKNGSSANTKELISILYEEKCGKNGNNLRNLIIDIKHTLHELEIQDFFITEYNNFRINPTAIKCDYYDFLSGKESAENAFFGEFMNQYSWAEETAAYINFKLQQKVFKN